MRVYKLAIRCRRNREDKSPPVSLYRSNSTDGEGVLFCFTASVTWACARVYTMRDDERRLSADVERRFSANFAVGGSSTLIPGEVLREKENEERERNKEETSICSACTPPLSVPQFHVDTPARASQ